MSLIEYYKSISDEMSVLKNRIRNIIGGSHWVTDGEWKESVLRTIIKRHAPENIRVGRGFVYTDKECSSQIDIIIYDSSYPTLFKEGDLVFITPDAVKGIIEVKSKATKQVLRSAMTSLSSNANLIHAAGGTNCFVGLFTFETDIKRSDWVLEQLKQTACGNRSRVITHISLGQSSFFRYWDVDPQNKLKTDKWHSYELKNLAPAYFINNLLSGLSASSILLNQDVWFPGESKERYLISDKSL